jgi:hypothetical protein
VRSQEGDAKLGRRVVTADDITLGDLVWFDGTDPNVLLIRNCKTSARPENCMPYEVLPGGEPGVVRFVPKGPDTGA